MKRKPTRKSGADLKADTPPESARAEPKLDPHSGPLVKSWNKMLKHFEKHAPKKDETSEFQLAGGFA